MNLSRDPLSRYRSLFTSGRAPLVLVFALAMAAVAPNLGGPEDTLYAVQGDSARYRETGEGLARFFEEMPRAVGRMLGGEFDEADARRYGMDGWILQHATAYVTALGAMFVSFGEDVSTGRVLSCLFFAAAAVLLHLYTRRHFGVVAAWLATFAFVFWPANLYFGTALMTEIPAVAFALLTVVALEWTRESSRPFAVALGGVAVGLLGLAKLTFRFVAVPLLVLDLLARRDGATARHLILRVAGILVLVALWGGFLRLAGLSGDPLGEEGGNALWLYRGNYVPDRGFENVGLGDVYTPELLRAAGEVEDLPPGELEKAVYSRALRDVVGSDPFGWLTLVLAKLGWLWTYPGIKEDLPAWFATLPPPALLQPIVVLLGALGVALACTQGWATLLPALLALYISGVHAASHLVSRYNVPALPLLLPYAAFAIVVLAREAARAVHGLRGRAASAEVADSRKTEPQGPGHRARGRRRRGKARFPGGRGGSWIPWVVPGGVGLLAIGLHRDAWIALADLPVLSAYHLQSFLIVLAIASFAWPFGRWLRSRTESRIRVALALLVFPGLVAAAVFGDRASNPDKDRFRARLEQPGDRLVQQITLSDRINPSIVRHGEVHLDLLPSLRGTVDLRVRLDGVEVHRFAPRLQSAPPAFQIDRNVNAVQERYRKVEAAAARLIDGYVARRHPEAPWTYFPQWYRVPVPVELLAGKSEVRIELELVAAENGGYVDCLGDQRVREAAPDAKGPVSQRIHRIVRAPAFFENAYELSSYQMILFATDRDRADPRLTRDLLLESLRTESAFVRDGGTLADLSPNPGTQTGEYRIRLRLGMKGGYVRRSDPAREGRFRTLWAVTPGAGDRVLRGDELRLLSARRHRFFDGYRTY